MSTQKSKLETRLRSRIMTSVSPRVPRHPLMIQTNGKSHDPDSFKSFNSLKSFLFDPNGSIRRRLLAGS